MMKLKFFLIFVFVSLFLLVTGTAVMAEEEVPFPYKGLKNPFPWDDASVQEEGKALYQQSCLGCHNVDGSSLAGADFSAADFPQSLEERAGLYFWILSEGRLDRGMPPFKSSFSEEQRWQVLTYLWSLGASGALAEVAPLPTEPSAVGEGNILLSAVPKQAQFGQPLTLTAVLQDSQDRPIGGAMVKFFVKVDFFTSGLMEVGEAVTNAKGVAVFEYTPKLTGNIQIVAHHGRLYTPHGTEHEAATAVTVAESAKPFYQAEAGIQLPAPGKAVFIGPRSALQLDKMGQAPASAFYLPGGILSWLLIVVVTIIAIWFTYFRVMYQLYRIPIVSEIRDTNTRLVPVIGLVIVLLLGIMLTLMLLIGPYSHFHLLQ